MKLPGRIQQFLFSIAGVVAITWIGYSIVPVNATTVAFAYLLLVLGVASTWGLAESVAASVLAALAFNFFFLEPKWTFTIADPHNWIALFSFLATALIASRLSTRAKRQTQAALEKQQDLERLYTFGRAILLVNDSEPIAAQLVKRLAEAFQLESATLFERRSGEFHRAGPLDFDGMESQLREAALQGTGFADFDRKRVIAAVRLGAEPIASLALQGAHMPDPVLQSITNLVAIGLERARAQDLAREVEVARRSDRLRTTLIDAMAHEFKTPLTSIRAATSALLAAPDAKLTNASQMLRIADEEAAHLEEIIDNALDMAQLESDRIDLNKELSNLNDLAREAVAALKSKAGDRSLEFQTDCEPLPVPLDRRLIKLAIKQLLDNALKYSPSDQPILLRSFLSDTKTVLEITDCGKGIPVTEQARIFDRFYRSPAVQDRVPGSGLGLSIAQRIVQAHGGEITVRSRPGETTFSLIFPMERP